MLSIIPGVLFRTIYVPNSLFDFDRKVNKERLQLKKEMGLKYTEDHHLIPKCLAKHPALYDININHCKNLKIMPNRRSNVSPIILKHEAHPAYNRYVKKHLDNIYYEVDEENRRYQLYLLLHDLEEKLNFGELPF
jgi:hypothetical protein